MRYFLKSDFYHEDNVKKFNPPPVLSLPSYPLAAIGKMLPQIFQCLNLTKREKNMHIL